MELQQELLRHSDIRTTMYIYTFHFNCPAWLQLLAKVYHNNFSPNWICREVVPVEVMTPPVGEGPPVAAA